MKHSDAPRLATLLAIFMACGNTAYASYDYFDANRTLIAHGVQAVLTCNGLFTSKRNIKQVFAQELKYLENPVGGPDGGNYRINKEQQWVEVGEPPYQVRAVFRQGIGCVVMAPDQNVDEIEQLPELPSIPLAGNAENIAWPDGDRIEPAPLSNKVDARKLQQASEWAFTRDTPEQDTLSLLVIHDGKIVHERYAPGVDFTTRTRTWSTAKSIAVTLIGMRVAEGAMTLDAPLNLDWLPITEPDVDPRQSITLRHLLNMSSGLYPVDSFKMEYATGSGLAYWAGASSVSGARNRGLIATPGSVWEYENYDTLLAVYAMKLTFKNTQEYLAYPKAALLDRIGMRNTLLSTDRFGDFVLSSQVYTNARDLGRFGLLYLNQGRWRNEQIIDPDWVEFARTPAPASKSRNYDYGGHFWLVPDDKKDIPHDAYSTAGNRGQFVIVVPSHNVVIVRRGLDYGQQGFDRWGLTREVLKAIDRP